MTIVLQIIFWISILIIFHSYVFYPLILAIFSKKKSQNNLFFIKNENLPKVSILLSVFNEEVVIAEKIESILNSDYPFEKLELIIGSDNSTDLTNQIIAEYCKSNTFINFYPFFERQGKQNVINLIFGKSNGDIIILTDANVIFHKNTIYEVVKNFKNSEIGLVDTQMINKGLVKEGISVQESSYISREVKIKNAESNLWGTMMGPFGGCYAIRRELYEQVPANFLVDDFYINMLVLEKGFKAINNLNAIVYEDVSNNFRDEFRRKIRIATGNFQNLKKFKHLLSGIFGVSRIKNQKPAISNFGLSFSFFSHKVLRWLIPFFIVLLLIINTILVFYKLGRFEEYLYLLTLAGLILSFFIPIFDIILKKININISLFRFVTHFYGMNLALLIGFFRFLKGVKSGIWTPTKRNQAGK